MNVEVIVGTYDSAIKGYSVDVLAAEERGLLKKYEEKEHTGCVRSVASGGRYLATGGTDETIKLYDMRRHTEIGTLLQHEGSITWLAFHKDDLLLSASEDGTICVWKCGAGWELRHTLVGHKYAVTCLSIHPSGKLILSVGRDRTLRTWNLLAGQCTFTQRLKKAADLVVWSPIADHYVLTFDSLVVVYQVETGTPTVTFDANTHVNCLLYIKDTLLAIGSEHHYIQLLSTSSGDCVAKLEGHKSRVKSLALSPGSELLFSASSDGAIKTWQIKDPLSNCCCVSSIDTRSRLTSMVLVSPESLLRELRNTTSLDHKHSALNSNNSTPSSKDNNNQDQADYEPLSNEPSLSLVTNEAKCEERSISKVSHKPHPVGDKVKKISNEPQLDTDMVKKVSARLTRKMKLKAKLSKKRLLKTAQLTTH